MKKIRVYMNLKLKTKEKFKKKRNIALYRIIIFY
jgi:hypothetical protein